MSRITLSVVCILGLVCAIATTFTQAQQIGIGQHDAFTYNLKDKILGIRTQMKNSKLSGASTATLLTPVELVTRGVRLFDVRLGAKLRTKHNQMGFGGIGKHIQEYLNQQFFTAVAQRGRNIVLKFKVEAPTNVQAPWFGTLMQLIANTAGVKAVAPDQFQVAQTENQQPVAGILFCSNKPTGNQAADAFMAPCKAADVAKFPQNYPGGRPMLRGGAAEAGVACPDMVRTYQARAANLNYCDHNAAHLCVFYWTCMVAPGSMLVSKAQYMQCGPQGMNPRFAFTPNGWSPNLGPQGDCHYAQDTILPSLRRLGVDIIMEDFVEMTNIGAQEAAYLQGAPRPPPRNYPQAAPGNNNAPPVNHAPPVNNNAPPVNHAPPVNNNAAPVNHAPPPVVNNVIQPPQVQRRGNPPPRPARPAPRIQRRATN
jgi:hypothetical protein